MCYQERRDRARLAECQPDREKKAMVSSLGCKNGQTASPVVIRLVTAKGCRHRRRESWARDREELSEFANCAIRESRKPNDETLRRWQMKTPTAERCLLLRYHSPVCSSGVCGADFGSLFSGTVRITTRHSGLEANEQELKASRQGTCNFRHRDGSDLYRRSAGINSDRGDFQINNRTANGFASRRGQDQGKPHPIRT
jgi:hypothetical protein